MTTAPDRRRKMQPTMEPHSHAPAPTPAEPGGRYGLLLVVLIDVACSLLTLALVALGAQWALPGAS